MSSGATTDRGAAADQRSPAELGHSTLVIGLGNPILGDDGVGWRVVDELEARLAGDAGVRRTVGDVELDRLAVGGLRLMERLAGYDRVVLVDAMLGSEAPGTVTVGSLSETASGLAGHLDSAHDVTLPQALSAGRLLGVRLPDEITVVGVAVRRVDTFDEHLSPEVAGAVGPAVERIVALLAHRSARAI